MPDPLPVPAASDRGSRFYTFLIALIAAIGGLLFGFDNGVIGGALPFVTKHFSLNAVQEGFAVSNLVIGATAGSLFAGMLADRFGRKKILVFTALLYVLTALCSGLATTFTGLVVARMIGGVAIGLSSVASPMYIAEIAPAAIRGRLVTINQLTIVVGILLAYFTNWLLVDFGADNWRWMFMVQALPAAAFFLALFAIPESPRWLLNRGLAAQARQIFTRIGGPRHADHEIRAILEAGAHESGSLRELLRPGYRQALVIGILLAFFAHMVGINAVCYYAPRIFLQAGFTSANTALLASLLVMVALLVFTVVAIFCIDRFGRRPLLLVGSLGMGLALVFTALAFNAPGISGGWLLAALMFYVACFAISMGGVIWVYLAEIFPNKVRARAMSIATMVLWLTEIFVTQTFPWFVETIQGNTFYLYAGICFAAFAFVWFMIIETKGCTLEEIEAAWKQPAP